MTGIVKINLIDEIINTLEIVDFENKEENQIKKYEKVIGNHNVNINDNDNSVSFSEEKTIDLSSNLDVNNEFIKKN